MDYDRLQKLLLTSDPEESTLMNGTSVALGFSPENVTLL